MTREEELLLTINQLSETVTFVVGKYAGLIGDKPSNAAELLATQTPAGKRYIGQALTTVGAVLRERGM